MTATRIERVRTAVLISGRGSNMEALIAASRDPDYPAQIVLVLANVEHAGGLETAHRAGIRSHPLPHHPFKKDREAHERALDAELRAHDVELVALAGYMRILTPWLVSRWRGRLLNIHPSLLPLYPGLHTHARAIGNGDRFGGCSVHLVSEGVDEGPVLGQERVPILDGDTPDRLAERVLAAEHQLYPRVLADYARRLRAAGPMVFSSGRDDPGSSPHPRPHPPHHPPPHPSGRRR